MKFNQSFNSGVNQSIFAGLLLLYFIQPLINIVWNVLGNTSNSFNDYWVSSIIKDCARNNRDEITLTIYLLVIFILSSIFIAIFLRILFVIKESKAYELKHTESQNVAIKSNIPEPKYQSIILNKGIYVFSALILVLFIELAGFFIRDTIIVRLNANFVQRLNVVAPYTSDKQQKMLISNWALMKNKSDYIAIMDTLKEIAKKNKIVLPASKLELKK